MKASYERRWDKENNMLIVVSEPCCKRKPFESHKEDCYFRRQKREMSRFIQNLIKKFEHDIKGLSR